MLSSHAAGAMDGVAAGAVVTGLERLCSLVLPCTRGSVSLASVGCNKTQ